MRLSCSSDGVIIAGGLNWWGKKGLFCLRLHLSSVIISEKNINLEMDKWLENSDHPLSECGVLAAELFMESLSPPENLNILCAQFSRGWGSVLRQKIWQLNTSPHRSHSEFILFWNTDGQYKINYTKSKALTHSNVGEAQLSRKR